jgi:hypothetical protein
MIGAASAALDLRFPALVTSDASVDRVAAAALVGLGGIEIIADLVAAAAALVGIAVVAAGGSAMRIIADGSTIVAADLVADAADVLVGIADRSAVVGGRRRRLVDPRSALSLGSGLRIGITLRRGLWQILVGVPH